MAAPSSVSRTRTDLAYFGVVTQVISNTQFVIAGLAGLGNGALVGYAAYVLAKRDGTTTAPHAEQPAVTAYVSASGTFTHVAYTVPLAVGDQLLLLHPTLATIMNIRGLPPVTGSTPGNWQAAEADIISIGADNIRNKLHSLVLDINALVGTVTIRLYMQVNGVERRVYQQTFTVAADGPGLWIVNGTIGIHEVLRVTAQSNNAADNGQAIAYDYLLEAM
jgi:hypothetical protein